MLSILTLFLGWPSSSSVRESDSLKLSLFLIVEMLLTLNYKSMHDFSISNLLSS